MSIEQGSKINQLFSLTLPNGLLFSTWLKEKGYSDQLLRKYRKSRWLDVLSKGVMFRTGEPLNAETALYCYNHQVHKNFRIAAHSALEYFGFNHFVPMGKPLLRVTSSKEKAPVWFNTSLFDKNIKVFQTECFDKIETSLVRYNNLDLLVSSPEQAFLECLLLAPKEYSYMDLYYIMEQLTTLRPEIIQSLLEHTSNIRVKRLFLFMAEKSAHYWSELISLKNIELGTSKLQFAKGGVYLEKYRMTIPKELYDYE